MEKKKFLDIGSPLETTVQIFKDNKKIKIQNPEKFYGTHLAMGCYGRIHSEKNGTFTVWVLDDTYSTAIIMQVPQVLMGQYFKQTQHGIFSHLAK